VVKPEELAQRFAEARPGYDLVDYAVVGLPMWKLQCRVSVREKKAMEPLDEFVLRAVGLGVTDRDEIARLLGLDLRVVETVLGRLLGVQLVELGFDGGIAITDPGRKIMRKLTQVVVETREVPLYIDGLTRAVPEFVADLLPPRELKEDGIRKVPAVPAKAPELNDVAPYIRDLQTSLERYSSAVEILSIDAVDRRMSLYKTAVALAFKSKSGTESRVALVVDGELSEKHETAFAQAGLAARFGIDSGGIVSGSNVAEEIIEPSVLHRMEGIASPSAQFGVATANGEDESEAPEPTPHSQPVVAVATYDHPEFLRKALAEARERILIVSPWIRRGVVNDEFLRGLDTALQRGVLVHIGWGISKEDKQDGPLECDHQPRNRLEGLSRKYPNLRFCRLGDTHAKILLCDQAFVITTSFNWLSFRGDPKRTFRDERGTLVAIPEYVDKVYEDLIGRFEPA
jgi:hypothetical protein